MKSQKNVVDLQKILPSYDLLLPFDLDIGLNKDTWHFKKGETAHLTYAQYEVLNHSEYGEELFRHNN